MQLICVILFLIVSSLWFLANEYPVLFGIYVPTCALKRVHFKMVVASVLLLSIYLAFRLTPDFPALSGILPCNIGSQSLMTVVLSALIILVILKIFSINGSSVYALLGGFLAYMISIGDEADHTYVLSFILAPFVAFLLAAFIRFIILRTLDRCNIHLITLSFYMRMAIIACVVLTAFSLGINWGGFIFTGAAVIADTPANIFLVLVTLALSISALSPFMRKGTDAAAGRYSDFSVYAILSVGFSTAAVMLFFSFESAVGLLGLKAVPLSPASLIFASIAGVETVKRTKMIERDDYAREVLALVLSPLGALVIASVIFALTGNNEEMFIDFTVMAAAMLILLSLAFVVYVRHQRMQKQATERRVYSQQQQIYENSRALHDMELKVILSENQALHNSIEVKKQEVKNVALSMVEQKEYLESLNSIVKKLSKSKDEKERDQLIAELRTSLRQRLSYDRDVDSQYFAAQAENIHEDFNAKLLESFPELTQQEVRLATLLRLGFSSKYIATLLSITPKSVEISRYRLRQKLGLSKGDNLVNFIKSI